MGKNNAKILDLGTLIQAGIDPRTGLPLKAGGSDPCFLKDNIKRVIEHIDEQDALNRFTWYNLPDGLDGKLIERILYYKGQGMFFYMPTNDQFFFLPYALDGTIDVYGRFKSVTPLPFGGAASTTSNGKEKPWIVGLSREPLEQIMMPDEIDFNSFETKCVLLHDYSKGLSETITPRCTLNQGLIDVEAECIPFMRTALIASTGVSGMRVESEDEQSNVKAASAAATQSALKGEKWIPILGNIEFQDLATGPTIASQEFMTAMNSIDTLRLSTFGLSNGGLMYDKSQYMNQGETEAAGMNTGLILNDGITLRQEFCNRVNSLFGLGIWCEITQPAMLQPDQSQSYMDDNESGNEGTSADNNTQEVSE